MLFECFLPDYFWRKDCLDHGRWKFIYYDSVTMVKSSFLLCAVGKLVLGEVWKIVKGKGGWGGV